MVQVYPIHGYGKMVADTGRTQAYRQAPRQTVTPDSVVVDIGTGAGILALLACRCGARRVYAIEPGDIIQVGRELDAANGFAHRIEFIQALSTQVTLPEPAHVIVSDLHGALPLFQQIIPFTIDARRTVNICEIPKLDLADRSFGLEIFFPLRSLFPLKRLINPHFDRTAGRPPKGGRSAFTAHVLTV